MNGTEHTLGTNDPRAVDPHWDITQKHADDITRIMSEVSGITAKVDGLQAQMTAGLSNIHHTLQQMSAPKPQGQWVGVGGLVMSLMIALGLVVSFTMSTLKAGTDQQFVSVFDDLADQKTLSARILGHFDVDDLRALADAEQRGASRAQHEALQGKVDHLDDISHIEKRIVDNRLSQLEAKDEMLQAGMRATGDYIKEHTNKTGGAGHPVAERQMER